MIRRSVAERRNFGGDRAGFTLIELTVSLTVIGLLASVTLPAILQVREAARRAHCQNNLRQMGTALHGFHATHDRFPPGWSSIEFSEDGAIIRPADFGCLWAWAAHLLPQLDQSGLHDQLGVTGFKDPPAPGEDLDLSLATFRCPSDVDSRESGWGLYRWNDTSDPPSSILYRGYAKSNYIAVNGNDVAPFQIHLAPDRLGASRAGIFGNETRTTIAHILDGTSNTLAIGERQMTRPFEKRAPRGAVWIRNVGELLADVPTTTMHQSASHSGLPPAGAGLWLLLAVHCDANSVVGVTTRESPLNHSEYGFSSQHPGGANFLFADGAVRFLSDGIDPATYENLGSMADGEVVSRF